jgi:hypothetical protein
MLRWRRISSIVRRLKGEVVERKSNDEVKGAKMLEEDEDHV